MGGGYREDDFVAYGMEASGKSSHHVTITRDGMRTSGLSSLDGSSGVETISSMGVKKGVLTRSHEHKELRRDTHSVVLVNLDGEYLKQTEVLFTLALDSDEKRT